MAAGIVQMKERWATAQRESLSVNNVFHLFKGTRTKNVRQAAALVEHADAHKSSKAFVALHKHTHATPLRLNRTRVQYTPELHRTQPSSKQTHSTARHTQYTTHTQSQRAPQVSACCPAVCLLMGLKAAWRTQQ